MDNFMNMNRGGSMLGSSKIYGSSRPQGSEWRVGDARLLDASRPFKDSQIQESPRHREDFQMQDSRLLVESGTEQNYSPPRLYVGSEVQRSVRIPDRAHGGFQLQREVRVHQDSRIESGNRSQENSRIFNVPLQDRLEPRPTPAAVAFDYNHRRSDDASSLKDADPQTRFMNSHENMRSGRRTYLMEGSDSVKQEFLDVLPDNISIKKNLDFLSTKFFQGPGITPGPSHILTPSLTSSGPQTSDTMRSVGNRDLFPKEKSSKAFEYLKNWRLKMNMPTDSFLLEKETVVGNQHQGGDVMPQHPHDDWYTQPPVAEPRRASIDPEWNCSGNSFTERGTYEERPVGKYGNIKYESYGESLEGFPKGQGLECDRTGNPSWKWGEELPSGQNQGAKRNYESLAAGQSFNQSHRDEQYLHDREQPKRPRLSPSMMQSERGGTVEQYTSVIPEQTNLSQNVMNSNDAKFKVSVSNTFYAPQSDWIPPGQSKLASGKFSRSNDSGGEIVNSRHKVLYEGMKGVGARERSQTSYIHSRDMKTMSELSMERLPEHLGRHKYPEPQERPVRMPGPGTPQNLHQDPMDQGRPPPNEMFLSSAPCSSEMSPRSYHGIRSRRSPVRAKSPGTRVRGKSPVSQRKSQATAPRGKYSDPNSREQSSPWRKGRSPGPGRDKAARPERGRSAGPAGLESSTGRRSALSGRPTGRQRSPGTQVLSGGPKRERSPELVRGVKSSGLGRGRSPGQQIRKRSPGSTRRERLSASPGRGRLLDRGRWRSPGRSLDYSGREKSPVPFRRERPPGSFERGQSPALLGNGRSQLVSSARDRSPRPLGGVSSGPLEGGRSTGKAHAGRRGSPGASEKGKLSSRMSSNPSGRGKSPGPERNRPSGTSGRARSPGAGGSDRAPRLRGKGKQTDGPGRRPPRQLVTGKLTKSFKEGPAVQQHTRSVSPVTGVSVERKVAKGELASLSSHHSRGRSPMKVRSPVGTRMRPELFFDGKQRRLIERFPRNRSSRSPVRRMSSDYGGKNETLFANEYRNHRREKDRSPYLEEVSSSPRMRKYWSPTGRAVMNIRSRHSRERSSSVGALQRGCSPVSVQSGDNPHPQDPYYPDRGHMLQEHSHHIYRSCSPLSGEGHTSARRNDLELEGGECGRQQERLHSFSRGVSFGTGRPSVEKSHSTKGIWREHNRERGGEYIKGKAVSSGRPSNSRNVKTANSTEHAERPEGTLLEEEVDDEDLRIHLLRLREQKVEMKLMKLEEESKETELKLLEFKQNQAALRETSPLEEEGSYGEKEPYRPRGRRQHSPSPQQERYYRQHKRF